LLELAINNRKGGIIIMKMSSGSFNPDQFKAAQKQSWDGVARGWSRWWKTFEDGAQVLSNRLADLAGVKPGSRVLDIATGIGEPAVTAARRVRPGGRVVATDISPQMLAVAAERAKALGLEDVMEFRQGDAETFTLPESSFDAVTCRWGLMFLPGLGAALGTIKRSLVPGGRLAAAVWAAPAEVPLLDTAFATARKVIGAPPPPAGTPGPFSLADAEALKSHFTQAGFQDVRAETLSITFRFGSAEQFTAFHQDIAAPIKAMIAGQSPDMQKKVWDAVTEEARKYAAADGSVSMSNKVICVSGRR
jgi:ubiquinone/menaquinone biosynthesis C-methylase UbiE